jgi:hypothetical protein
VSIGPRLRSWIETHGAHVALALGVLTGFWLLIAPVRIVVKWGAVALLLFAGGELVRRFGPGLAERAKLRLSGVLGRGRQLAPYAFVTLVTLWLLGPVALGQMPATQDHASHYLATDIFVKDMIGSGRLFGWTERLGAGYPFGDLYPTLSYLVTGLLHLVTLGRVPLDVSYAFGMTLIWLILALGVARLAHRLANGWAAAFAGIAIAADPGADREGGWGYAMFHGVWTQQLAVGFWVLALLVGRRCADVCGAPARCTGQSFAWCAAFGRGTGFGGGDGPAARLPDAAAR